MAHKKQKLKKIKVKQLILGMFVHELCGSWMDHPFWNTRFLLEDPADLARLQHSAVREIWIDVARGADLPEAEQAPADDAEKNAERNEAELRAAATAKATAISSVDLASEVTRAAKICSRAKTAVGEMFKEARMGQAVNTAALDPLIEDISASVSRNPGALISLARLKTKDDYTYMHSVAVCGLMLGLARQLDLDKAIEREIALAGMVHDVGKACMDMDILNKPGKLTDGEFKHIQRHPEVGHQMLLEGAAVGEIPLDVCLHHHEKMDGSGYPEGLAGDDISIYARMGAVCDVYDAITSDRPYKRGWDPSLALRKMNEWKGHFDPHVFQAFVKTVGIYPVGSLIRLESGLLGVVTEVDSQSLLTPVVKTFYCTRRQAPQVIRMVDLGAADCADQIKRLENPADWPFDDLNNLWAGDGADRARVA